MTGSEVAEKRYRKSIPEAHRGSVDTRLRWLWNQRFGTVQNIWKQSDDLLDRTACTIVLQCALGDGDLESIKLLLKRIEGGAQPDTEVLDQDSSLAI